MATVALSGIGKGYDSKSVLHDLSLTVQDGECFTLLGPSGCGKTVLLRLIAGFEKPDSGTVRIGDSLVADADDMTPPNERGLGVVFQDYAVWPHKSVYDNIAYPLQLAKTPADELHRRVMEVVKLVNLTDLEKRMPSQLSGGQQQRVALARALVARPALLLLDEPLCNLDANLREEMRFEIKVLQKNLGITILYVTHDQEIALAISDRIGVMDEQGCLRQIGTPQEIFEHPADEFVFRFMGVTNTLTVLASSEGCYTHGDVMLPWRPPQDVHSPSRCWRVGFRPSDITVLPAGEGIPAVVRRASFLGAMTELRIGLGEHELRAQVETLHLLQNGQTLRPGDACGLGFSHLHWFPTEGCPEETSEKPAPEKGHADKAAAFSTPKENA